MSRQEGRDHQYTDADLPKLYAVFHGDVVSVQKYGVFVSIPGYKRHGLVHVSQMSNARIEDPSEMLAKGEKVYCKVITIETEGSKVGLSMKVVNQATGQDLDPNNIQSSQDAKKRKQFFGGQKPPIELGAVYDTTCRTCGGRGHLAMECFVGRGRKQYDLVPDLEDMVHSDLDTEPPPQATQHSHKKKKKKEKKVKKEKKKKRKHSTSSSDSSEEEEEERHRKEKRGKEKETRHKEKKKKRKQSSSSYESSEEEDRHHKEKKGKKKRKASISDDDDNDDHKHRRQDDDRRREDDRKQNRRDSSSADRPASYGHQTHSTSSHRHKR